jgi:hypothetical protein
VHVCSEQLVSGLFGQLKFVLILIVLILFWFLADQIFGDEEMHSTIRSHCMDYIVSDL